MIITQKIKQTSKQTKEQTKNRDRLYNKQTYICIVLLQSNGKTLMKVTAISAKTLKAVKYLAKI